MGCLKNILFLIILAFAAVGFWHVGGADLVMNGINGVMNPPVEKIEEKAQKIADFSHMPQEYELKRTVDMLGIKAVMSNHKQTGQKMILADAGNLIQITEKDIETDKVEDKLHGVIDKYAFMPVKVSKFEIVGKGKMEALGKLIPYVKLKANLEGTPYENVEGTFGVVPMGGGSSKFAISLGEEGSFDKKIAEDFFKTLK